jgi:site-specific recombinase XerD
LQAFGKKREVGAPARRIYLRSKVVPPQRSLRPTPLANFPHATSVSCVKSTAIEKVGQPEAAAKLRNAMTDRDAGLLFADQNQTLGEYLDRWLSTSVHGCVKNRTFERYEEMVHIHIKPILRANKLSKLRPADMQHLYRDRLDSGLSAGTVRHVHVTLHKALKRAVEWDLVPHNVTEVADVPKASKEETLSLSVEQVRALLEAVKGEHLRPCLRSLSTRACARVNS